MMLLAWLLGFVMPACAAQGAGGLPAAAPMDMARIERPASPNTALAGPAGFTPKPDMETPAYPRPAPALYAALRAMVLRQPRIFLQAEYADRLQLHVVARSALMNFPDLVTVQVMAAGPAASTLVIYSRSLYGHSDLGVNRKRLSAWLAELDADLKHSPEG